MAESKDEEMPSTLADKPVSQEQGDQIVAKEIMQPEGDDKEMLTEDGDKPVSQEQSHQIVTKEIMQPEGDDREMLTEGGDKPGFQEHGDQHVDDDVTQDSFDTEIGFLWNSVITRFVNSLPEDEMDMARKTYCRCVNSIIDAYHVKLDQIRTLQNVIKVWKKRSNDKSERIRALELENTNLSNQNTYLNSQLASKVCEECGEKRITEQLNALTMETTNESPENSSETDGGQAEGNKQLTPRKRAREVEENDSSSSDEDPALSLADIYKCPYASCGLDALLYMIYKIRIRFCPSKFMQAIGASARVRGPKCTDILNNLKDEKGHFLEIIDTCESIDEGRQKEALENAKAKFKSSKQDVGILSYRTDSYNHCVNIYTSKKGKVKIYDASKGMKYIENLEQVHYLEVAVLRCYEKDGVYTPYIIERWSKCHVRHCGSEVQKRSKPGNTSKVFVSEPGTKQL